MKRATYYSDAVESMIAPIDSESFSGRVGFLIQAANAIAEESCPALLESEWLALADANKGTAHTFELGAASVISGMLHNLFDSADELDGKWGVDCLSLARRLGAMSFAERFAVFEIVRRFWSRDMVKDYRAYLLSLGAIVK